ncbi:hypothetical protein METBIDRAFT_174266 [Metschnikowia bicuspidata var. bicuspidata NRRL YB-4993]|uniref:Uncharacterized protein n=1 Tax=Metschnikowia bicuspidata var. bicuspidata NRRL YB-4993 TaxID=869754 RepID=A0A1A0HAT3_9ASCO|nr:hypothetical protein METBIDRAFT_174266 [Metschnikowia bicuspidata var. bicuspidata NRRL YB-4993]OBA21105.1 hypothetical protein METBIDRAFT_174266 [Metschnikowia bicuspidata var. bicuspidata NRRL YB-4993]
MCRILAVSRQMRLCIQAPPQGRAKHAAFVGGDISLHPKAVVLARYNSTWGNTRTDKGGWPLVRGIVSGASVFRRRFGKCCYRLILWKQYFFWSNSPRNMRTTNYEPTNGPVPRRTYQAPRIRIFMFLLFLARKSLARRTRLRGPQTHVVGEDHGTAPNALAAACTNRGNTRKREGKPKQILG